MSKGIARLVQVATRLLVVVLLAGSPALVLADELVERLSVPGPLELDGQQYHLAWTSHPLPHFYKQEYLPQGQTLPRYRQMLMLDLLTVDATPAQLALAKIEELDARKPADPLVNHDIIVKPDGSAVLLDFVLSAPDANGDLIVEWNAYRYEARPEGVLLFGISRRGYGHEDARRFLGEELKQNRSRWIDEMAGLAAPAIALVPSAAP
jgi:hypothetical protein